MAKNLSVLNDQLFSLRPQSIPDFLKLVDKFEWNEKAESLDVLEIIDCTRGICTDPKKWKALLSLKDILTIRAPSSFPKLSIPVVVYELVLRVLRPRRIDQKQFGLCGPAAFGCLLVQTRPLEYVRMAYDLLKCGRTHVAGLEINPRRRIREFDPRGKMGQADWLIMASLRNSSKKLSQDMENTGVYSNTYVWRMFEWLKQAGYRTIVSIETAENAWLSKPTRFRSQHYYPKKPDVLAKMTHEKLRNPSYNLRLAKRFLFNEWKVFLLITEKIAGTIGAEDPIEKSVAPWKGLATDEKLDEMKADAKKALIGEKPNHWAMVTNIEITTEKKIRLTRFSYGTLEATAPVPQDIFNQIYGGFVAINEADMKDAFKHWRGRDAAVEPYPESGKAAKT